MNQLVILPFLTVLVTAVLTLLTRKWTKVQSAISILGLVGYITAVFLLSAEVFPNNILTYQLSNWPAPYGISFVADGLSAFMLCTTAAIVLPALIFSLK